MSLTIFDLLGLVGVVIILATYLALQFERIDAQDWRYSALNASGAVLIIISLVFDFNLASFVIELSWLAISLIGLCRSILRKA